MLFEDIIRNVALRVIKPGDTVEMMNSDFKKIGFPLGEYCKVIAHSEILNGCLIVKNKKGIEKTFYPGYFRRVSE